MIRSRFRDGDLIPQKIRSVGGIGVCQICRRGSNVLMLVCRGSLESEKQLWCLLRSQWPGGKVPASGRRFLGSKPYSTEDPPCVSAWRALHLTSWVKCSPTGVEWKFR
ncbi:hypothetical protein AVEN_109319-1 [Araneus ventricosus]|uniref:Uncharacterized protein n=1 Tax=Araneus ventricosus TaxID=182803 RepID=A0A4Y2D184_ARAVE|nr:hypothetical protein AVEN_109319-1 [Araneus ventricosus]